MLTRAESRQIVDFVIREIRKHQSTFVTDGRIDLSKSSVGSILGTISGGAISPGAVWNYHINPNADIQGTKIRVATDSERGTVVLGEAGDGTVPTVDQLTDAIAAGLSNFLSLLDTPSTFRQVGLVPTIDTNEAALEWKPVTYVDGRKMNEGYEGAIDIAVLNPERDFTNGIVGGTFTMNQTLNGGSFV